MEDNGSKKIVDLYYRANMNKYDIALENSNGKDFSKAEMVVLACLALVGREAEMSKLPYYPSEVDYNKLIKAIIVSSLDGMTDGLTKKEEYDNLINYFKESNPEVYGSVVIYKSMLDNFAPYLDPVYPEEKFVYDHLKLHDVTRIGHLLWGVKAERKESVLEHIYGCLVLAVGMESEYSYDIDFSKLYKMLLIHEVGETSKIGDQSQFQMTDEERLRYEREAARRILLQPYGGQKLYDLWEEFNTHAESESLFAYLIDKLEYNMQVKAYDDMNMFDFENRPVNKATTNGRVLEIINNGANSVFDVHYEFDKSKFFRVPCMRRILEEVKNYHFVKGEIVKPERTVIPRLALKK